MALKTIETKKSVKQYLDSIENDLIREESKKLLSFIKKITNKQPKLWGTIIGFGKYKYRRKNSKEELEWFNVGFAPRKDKISIYVTCYLEKEPLVKKLGKAKFGKGCIYIKKLEDIDLKILEKLILKYKDANWHTNL